ncbi:MAG TPA: nuclear transport factor 2 family protein [Gammaproteobacteria bacterium]|nr:nuclear transport factor 2 family protein [Gammaproteobacteria bacterium]
MSALRASLVVAAMLAAGTAAAQSTLESRREEVFTAERAFARTMAERDFAAFGRYVAADCVFFSGNTPLRGRDAVLAAWKAFFDGAQAPFSWEPDQVEVLASGELALSTGLVKDPAGAVAARFNTIWQRQPDGRWLVIFDKGGPAE